MDITEKIARQIEIASSFDDYSGSVFDETCISSDCEKYREFLLQNAEKIYDMSITHHERRTYKIIPIDECKSMSLGKLNKYWESFCVKSFKYHDRLHGILEYKEYNNGR